MIYLDSGATSVMKPKCVIKALNDAACCGNPGRGGHSEAIRAARLLFKARQTVARHFHSDLPEGVCFFCNATTALNVVVKSLVPPSGRILLSDMEHNALRRPALALSKKGVRVDYFKGYGSREKILASFNEKIKNKPDLAAFIFRSNICPQTLPVKKLCEMAKKEGVPTLIDCAAAGGHDPIDLSRIRADGIVLPSHKGLLGVMGAGMLVCTNEMKEALEKTDTLFEGGSGMNSFDDGMPDVLPERLEWGTPALPAIASVCAGIEYIEKVGYEQIQDKLERLSSRCAEGIASIPGVELLGMEGAASCGGSLLFRSLKEENALLCEKLYKEGVCVREGFHCAPLAHKSIGSEKTGGVRVSFSIFNTPDEISRFLCILKSAASE